MNIIVTVKQVPDPNVPAAQFKVDEQANRVVLPSDASPVMNGYDENALEEAIRLKEKHGGKVTAVTLGDDDARDALKRAIAMGADEAIHVNDPSLLDGDTFATAQVLAAAIKKIGEFDLVLCGRQASDTDAGQVLFGIAEFLGLPVVSPIKEVEAVDGNSLTVHRITDDGYQRVQVVLPAVIGVSSEINEPRYPPLKGVIAAGRAKIPVWTAADIGLDGVRPRIELRRVYIERSEAKVELIEADSPEEAGRQLADKLREARLV